MEKNTVTRTFSIGALCNGSKAIHSDHFSTARRHSSAGIRALLWATSSAKSLGCSLGSDSQTSRENIFPNILTPESIPQFTIPSLSVQNSLRSLDSNKEASGPELVEGVCSSGTETESPVSVSSTCSRLSSSTSLSAFGLMPSDRKAERSISDPLTHRRAALHREVSFPCAYTEAQHCLDPASRAALSLPHLAKVTTPYGFVTLSQSPQMANEEMLLCQAGLRRLNKEREAASPLSNAPIKRADGTKHSSCRKTLSMDAVDPRALGGSAKPESSASSDATAASSSPSSTTKHPEGKLRRRFYHLIKKHFSRH